MHPGASLGRATVAVPVGISVADARVEEDAGAVLAFAVTLSRAASGVLTVDYATADGSAQADVDYTAASGALTFRAGESSKTIEVAVLDDAHDEGEETLTLTLSNPSAGRLTDAVQLLRPRGGAVARRRRAHDLVRRRLREGPAGGGPVALAQPGAGPLRRRRRRPGGVGRDGPLPVARLAGNRARYRMGRGRGAGGMLLTPGSGPALHRVGRLDEYGRDYRSATASAYSTGRPWPSS